MKLDEIRILGMVLLILLVPLILGFFTSPYLWWTGSYQLGYQLFEKNWYPLAIFNKRNNELVFNEYWLIYFVGYFVLFLYFTIKLKKEVESHEKNGRRA